MEKPSVYTYDQPGDFLADYYKYRKTESSQFSLRGWAQRMGFKNHSLLSFLIKGSRPIKPNHTEKLLKGLNRLSDSEIDYFITLVNFEDAGSDEKKSVYKKQLTKLKKSQSISFLEVEKFKVVSDWVSWAIAEMTSLFDFKPNSSWIAKRLGSRRSPQQIEETIERLIAVGLLKEEPDGKLSKNYSHSTTTGETSSRAIRNFHRDMVNLSYRALESQSKEERISNSFTLTINPKRLPEAEKLIEQFQLDLCSLLEEDPRQETYGATIQLFRVTEPTS